MAERILWRVWHQFRGRYQAEGRQHTLVGEAVVAPSRAREPSQSTRALRSTTGRRPLQLEVAAVRQRPSVPGESRRTTGVQLPWHRRMLFAVARSDPGPPAMSCTLSQRQTARRHWHLVVALVIALLVLATLAMGDASVTRAAATPTSTKPDLALDAATPNPPPDATLNVNWDRFLARHDLLWRWRWGEDGRYTIQPTHPDLTRCGPGGTAGPCCLQAGATPIQLPAVASSNGAAASAGEDGDEESADAQKRSRTSPLGTRPSPLSDVAAECADTAAQGRSTSASAGSATTASGDDGGSVFQLALYNDTQWGCSPTAVPPGECCMPVSKRPIPKQTRTQPHTHIYANTHTHAHVDTQPHTHAHMRAYLIHRNRDIHAHTHTHT